MSAPTLLMANDGELFPPLNEEKGSEDEGNPLFRMTSSSYTDLTAAINTFLHASWENRSVSNQNGSNRSIRNPLTNRHEISLNIGG